MGIKEIIFKDASQEGYEAGEERAIKGKNKSPWRTWTETNGVTKAKFGVQGSSAIDSWNLAYDKAYATTMQAKIASEVSKTQPITTETHNNNNNNNNFKDLENMQGNEFYVERQIELLYQLMASLNKTKEIVYMTVSKYKRTYETLGNTMLQDTVIAFRENYERTVSNAATMVKQIDDIDIPFIKNEISFWQSHR
jgi:hypothetical protein